MDESKRRKIILRMFPLGTVGRDMMYALFNTADPCPLHKKPHRRMLDALNDPVMGSSIKRTLAAMLLSCVLYPKKYTLDETQYKRICKELSLRKEAGK